jgi:Ras-related protein Rab-32
MDQKREYLFKVLVIGELATGKTALVKRYVHNFFSEHYRATVGFLKSYFLFSY